LERGHGRWWQENCKKKIYGPIKKDNTGE
jgi:hypothetical protein